MRAYLTILMLLSASASLAAQESVFTEKDIRIIESLQSSVHEPAPGRWQIEGPTWIVLTPHGARYTAETLLLIEQFTREWLLMMGSPRQWLCAQKPILHIHGSDSDYRAIPDIPAWSEGIFRLWIQQTTNGRDVRLHLHIMHLSDSNAQRISATGLNVPLLRHEASHALLTKLTGARPIPAWLNEGLACWFESWSSAPELSNPRRIRNRRQASRRINWLRIATEQSRRTIPPIDDILAMNSIDALAPDHGGEATCYQYALCESLFDALYPEKEGRRLIITMLQRHCAKTFPLLSASEMVYITRQWHETLQRHWGVRHSALRR